MKTRTSEGFLARVAETGVRTVVVAAGRAGQRIDNFLLVTLKGVPKSHVYRLLRTGQVRVDGRRARPEHRLSEGERVRIPPVRMGPEPPVSVPPDAAADRIEATIIHSDRDFIVLDKPTGLASHGGSGIRFGAIELLRAARPRETLELAHRLDRDTSGVLVISRRRSALTALQVEIRAGRVQKRYLALLRGALPQASLVVDAPLRKDAVRGGERIVMVDAGGRPARSRFVELERYPGSTLAEVTIESGRTHQIRVHAAHIGNPLAGDSKYGDREFDRRLRSAGLARMFLHASRFAFGLGDRHFDFSAPLPEDLAAVLDKLTRTGRGG